MAVFLSGTRVIRVFATDADGSGPNGEVTYSIVSTHDKFSIDPKTGWLVTNAVRKTKPVFFPNDL